MSKYSFSQITPSSKMFVEHFVYVIFFNWLLDTQWKNQIFSIRLLYPFRSFLKFESFGFSKTLQCQSMIEKIL